MATDARLHSAFSSTEHPDMAGLNAMSLSINDVMPASNATTQASQAATLSGAGVSFSATPLVTIRADAPGLHRIEYSYDGSVFLPGSGTLHFASVSAMNTWTTANSALLTSGDVCNVAGALYTWTGTAWTANDTGWVGLTLASGYTGTIEARSLGGIVLLQGQITKTAGFATSTVYDAVITMPAQFTPGYWVNRMCSGNSAPNAARCDINGSDLQIITGASAPSYVDVSGLSGYTTT